MPACCCPGCSNRTEKGFRLFGFPQGARNADRRNIWIENINRPEMPSAPYICEVHFEHDQFENNRQDGKRPLKGDAIPTIFNKEIHPNPKTCKTRLKSEDPLDITKTESSEGTRRSSRRRKPIKFEEYESEEDEPKIEMHEKPVLKVKQEQSTIEKKITTNEIRCRTCLIITRKNQGNILRKLILGKTIKHTISSLVPTLSYPLSETDYICDKCCRLLIKFSTFVDSIIDSDVKLKTGKISLEVFQSGNEEDNSLDGIKETSTLTETSTDKTQNLQNINKKVVRQRKQDLVNSQKDDSENVLLEEQSDQEASEVVPKKRGRKRKIENDEGKEDEADDNEVTNMAEHPIESDSQQDPSKANTDSQTQSITSIEPEEVKSNPTEDSTIKSNTDHDYIPEEEEGESEIYRCPSCQTDYRTIRGIKSHLINQHDIQEEHQFECAKCNMKFIRFKDMMKHKSNHGFPCDLCEEILSNEEDLSVHKNNHLEIYCCVKCGKKFENAEIMTKHSSLHDLMVQIETLLIKREIEQSQNDFKCQHCDASFRHNRVLHDHIKSVHLKIRDIECKDCTKKFSTKALLRHHWKTRHSSEVPYKCDECDAAFKRKSYLDNHKLTHTAFVRAPALKTYSRLSKTMAKEFQCPFCPSKSSTKQLLITHLAVHASERKFTCKYCGLRFSNHRTKYVHERTHESIPENTFVCMTCWKKFPTEEILQTHSLKHTDNLKRFDCCLCGSLFSRKLILENHIFDVHVRSNDATIANTDPTPSEDTPGSNVRIIEIEWETDEENEEVDEDLDGEEDYEEEKNEENNEQEKQVDASNESVISSKAN